MSGYFFDVIKFFPWGGAQRLSTCYELHSSALRLFCDARSRRSSPILNSKPEVQDL